MGAGLRTPGGLAAASNAPSSRRGSIAAAANASLRRNNRLASAVNASSARTAAFAAPLNACSERGEAFEAPARPLLGARIAFEAAVNGPLQQTDALTAPARASLRELNAFATASRPSRRDQAPVAAVGPAIAHNDKIFAPVETGSHFSTARSAISLADVCGRLNVEKSDISFINGAGHIHLLLTRKSARSRPKKPPCDDTLGATVRLGRVRAAVRRRQRRGGESRPQGVGRAPATRLRRRGLR